MSIPEAERVFTPPNLFDAKISRRDFIAKAALIAGTVTTLAGVKKVADLIESGELEGGIRLYPPKLKVERLNYTEDIMNPFMGRPLVDFDNFFTENRPLDVIHRAGNTIEDINRAYPIANIFDIDVNDVFGTLYGEHGIIPHIKVPILNLKLKIPMVIDLNEVEVRMGMPTTFEDLIKHIHSLSTPDKPLGVFLDLKYGDFEEKTLEKLIDTLIKYRVSAIFDPKDKKLLQRIRNVQRKKEINPHTGIVNEGRERNS
ncbi:MAG: hypothetical protein M1365_16960 [Actinobacteria bacterium]|nr:hypothetical protein [Actinomycetota bacterium]